MSDEWTVEEIPDSAFEASLVWVRLWVPGVKYERIGVSKARIGRYVVCNTDLSGWIVYQESSSKEIVAILEDHLSPHEAVGHALALAVPETMEVDLLHGGKLERTGG